MAKRHRQKQQKLNCNIPLHFKLTGQTITSILNCEMKHNLNVMVCSIVFVWP